MTSSNTSTTSTTSTTSRTDSNADVRSMLDRAIATAGSVVSGVRSDQLDAPTPCSDMNVRVMLGHLVGVLDRMTALGNGEDPFVVVETPQPDDGWVAAWTAAADRATTAWRTDEVLERPMALPWIQGSGAEVLATYFSELTVHTWDLADATDQRPQWDDEVVALVMSTRNDVLPAENRLAMFEEISRSMGFEEVAIPFADAVAVPDDAPAIDRLVAWFGRDPVR